MKYSDDIKVKKDVSGLKIFLEILEDTLKNIEFEIINKSNQNCLIELNRLKYKIELDIKGTKKRIEVLK